MSGIDFKCFTCGNEGAPVAGSTIFTSDFLKDCIVSHIIVNNENENQQNPIPDFTHNYVDGYIDRKPNIWVVGDKLLVYYKNCSNCNC